MILRFLGTESDVAGKKLTRFGESLDVSDHVGQELITRSKCPILPQVEFEKIGFTVQELTQFEFSGTHAEAPQTFLDRKRRALVRLGELRAGLPVETNETRPEA